jgi:hypothetical protein
MIDSPPQWPEVDAFVWALTELFPQQRRAIPKVRSPV